MTRSRARAQPDTYTTVSAQLKIIKVLVDELLSASGSRNINASAADLDDEDGASDDDDGEWEDDGADFLDLGTGMTKAQLMGLGGEGEAGMARGRDDETQEFLMEFFRTESSKEGFGEVFAALSEGEQEKLRSMS